MNEIECIQENATFISECHKAARKEARMPYTKNKPAPFDGFQLWDIVSRDGTDQQLVYGLGDNLNLVCIKSSELGYMQSDSWVIGETESNCYWRYELVSKCLTPETLLKQIGRLDLWIDHKSRDKRRK